MKEVLFLFMMFSIVGWLWETPWVSIKSKRFINRGFLRGPYIPIYGCAIITIVFAMKLFENIENVTVFIILVEMVYMAFITASWEFVTSWGLEKVFHTRWWDYSTHKYNLQGRVSLGVSVFFGLGGYILWRFVLVPFEWIYSETPVVLMSSILIVFYIFFTIDSYFTVRDLFKVRDIMKTIERISHELGEEIENKLYDIMKEYQVRKGNLLNHLLEVKNQLAKRYETNQDTNLTSRVKCELEKITKLLLANRNVSRLYRKYPNSYSSQLLGIRRKFKEFTESLKK